jgi:23S rRNA pseudouridine1911/1915/1917 synthase
MRLDKRIAQLFGLSRRAAQAAVRQGQVDVNGEPCLEPAGAGG